LSIPKWYTQAGRGFHARPLGSKARAEALLPGNPLRDFCPMTKIMTTTLALAAAFSLFAASGALAQASNSQPGSTMMMKKDTAPKSGATSMKSDAAGMSAKTDQSADAGATATPKKHHKMAKNEAALNAQEAETTKQLNEQQAQMAQNAQNTQ